MCLIHMKIIYVIAFPGLLQLSLQCVSFTDIFCFLPECYLDWSGVAAFASSAAGDGGLGAAGTMTCLQVETRWEMNLTCPDNQVSTQSYCEH